jgi:hypothetical protein
VLLADNFADPSKGVITPGSTAPDQFELSYVDGELLVWRKAAATSAFIGPVLPGTFGDTTIAVDVRATEEVDQDVIGFDCRLQRADGRSYFFEVYPARQMFQLFRRNADNSSTSLIDPTGSQAIKQGSASNHIEYTCAGPNISASINGVQVMAVQDATMESGLLRIAVGGERGRSLAARFDNLVVTQR